VSECREIPVQSMIQSLIQRMCIHVPTKPLHRTFPVFPDIYPFAGLASCVKGVEGEKEKEKEPPYPISGIHTHHSFGDLGTDISSQDLRPVRVQDVQVWSALASCYEMRNEKRDS
jgi:hypothetical protein